MLEKGYVYHIQVGPLCIMAMGHQPPLPDGRQHMAYFRRNHGLVVWKGTRLAWTVGNPRSILYELEAEQIKADNARRAKLRR